MVSAIEPMAVVMKPGGPERLEDELVRRRRPTNPATTKAASSDGTIGPGQRRRWRRSRRRRRWSVCEASAKFVKRSTAKIAVSPIAGTARMVPDIRPLRMSCSYMCMAYYRPPSIECTGYAQLT